MTLEPTAAMLGRAFDPTALRTMSLRENHYLLTFVLFTGMLGAYAVRAYLARPETNPWVRLVALSLANGVMFFGVFLLLRPIRQFIYFQF